MGYICAKPMNLGGTNYRPGDLIPDGAILATRVRTLKKEGYIVESKEETGVIPVVLEGADVMQFADCIPVILGDKEEETPVSTMINAEQIQRIVDIMKLDAKEAAKAIADEVDEDVLDFIGAVDSRKTVKEAVSKQKDILSNLRTDTNAPTDDREATEASEE